MGNRHVLDIYPHAGDRSCLGCVPDDGSGEAAEDQPAAGAGAGSGSGGGATSAAAPATGAAAPAPAIPPNALFGAAWGMASASLHSENGIPIRAQADNLPDGTTATLTISDRAGRLVSRLPGTVTGGVVEADWLPSLAEGMVPEVTVTVDAGGHTSTSGVLTLTSFVDFTVVHHGGDPAKEMELELVLPNGERSKVKTGTDGRVRVEGVHVGEYELHLPGALAATNAPPAPPPPGSSLGTPAPIPTPTPTPTPTPVSTTSTTTPTPTPTPSPAPACPDCVLLQAMIDDGSAATRLKKGGSDRAAITNLQKHLAGFGFDVGTIDGKYGGQTGDAVGRLMEYDGVAFPDPRTPGPDAARLVIRRHTEAYRLPLVASTTKIKSGALTVGGRPFAEWFNTVFQPRYPGNHPTYASVIRPQKFLGLINKPANFVRVFSDMTALTGQAEVELGQFLTVFCIMYNETGGKFEPSNELGQGTPYQRAWLEGIPGATKGYNFPENPGVTFPHRAAGDQLVAKGLIPASDRALWNGQVWPDAQPPHIKAAALDCDFAKFRGHGFLGMTFRHTLMKHYAAAFSKRGHDLETMTTAAADVVFLDWDVNIEATRSFLTSADGQGPNFAKTALNPPDYFPFGRLNAGEDNYGHLFRWRCEQLTKEMIAAGYTSG